LLDAATSSSPGDIIPSDLDAYDKSTSCKTLFRHTKREQWGLGIVLRMYDDRVRMQFQDGRTRTFKAGFYHLIDAVDRPLDVTASIVEALRSMTDEDLGTTGPSVNAISMAEQIELLREMFPDGFQDAGYAEHHRGDGRKRPLKRHRDALVERAQGLKKKPMVALLNAGDYAEIHAIATKLVGVTDLVSAKERKAFKQIDEAHFESLATTMHALLHGSSKLAVRFDAFVRAVEAAMGDAPTWGLATVFLGAVHPTEYVVVREKVLELQSEWMAPGLGISERPMGILYERLREMAARVKEELTNEDLEPRDLLDVLDFMWATLRPKSRNRILEMRRERAYGVPVSKKGDESDREAA